MTLRDLYQQYEWFLRPALRIGPVFGGVALVAWRVRETRVPLTARAVVIPPVAMSTGFLMFLSPIARVPWTWALAALLLGVLLLALPLVHSSRLERRDGVIHMQRSRAFLWILLGLFALRIALHDWIGHLISPLQTAALFYLTAFGMIVRWRATLYRAMRRLEALEAAPAVPREPTRG